NLAMLGRGISAADDRGYNGRLGSIAPTCAFPANLRDSLRVRRGRGERPARILTHAYRAGRSDPAGDRRAVEGTSRQHVCGYAAGERACAADRRFTQPGHYLLECLG